MDLLPLPLNSDTKNSSTSFPSFQYNVYWCMGLEQLKIIIIKELKEKNIYFINEKEWEAWTIQQTQIFFRRREKEGVSEAETGFLFVSAFFVFFVPSLSSPLVYGFTLFL